MNAPAERPAQRIWLDVGMVCLLAAALVFPLFRLHYLNNWPSIESTFIADGRMFAEGWPHHLWQPLWYAGTRSDYVYPPGLRYAVALLLPFVHHVAAHAYHIAIGCFYIFGIAVVYLWVRGATGNQRAAWLAAIGVALLSPCFLLLPDVRADSRFLVPWRLRVLMTYGEGPHISSLGVLPLVWLGAWRRFHGGGARWLLLGAVAAAAVVTLNFYGATALAITFPLLAWACWLERRDWRIFRDSVILAALAYGLTAWWLAPSYLQITSRNLRLVAPAGNAWSLPVLVAVLAAYVGLSLVLRGLGAYAFFIGSVTAFLSLYILGYRWFGFQVAGNSLRLIPEFDLFIILCAVEIVRRVKNPPQVNNLPHLLCFVAAWPYLSHVYSEFPRDREWQQRVEYRTPSWLDENFPGQRVFVSGSIRIWYNVWHDGQQADGGSDQGILNPLLPAAKWAITHTDDAERLRAWLLALGVDIVVVPGPTSQEMFKEFEHPQLYAATFPLLRDDGGTRYYRVPRRSTGIVRMVDRARLDAVAPLPREPAKAQIAAYAEAVETSSGRASGVWRNGDTLDISAEAAAGEALLVQETYDPYWRADVDGRPAIVRRDAAGFMLLPLERGKHSVHLAFQTPRELIVGRGLAAASLLIAIYWLVRPMWGRISSCEPVFNRLPEGG